VMFPSLIEDLFVTVRPLADEYGSTLSLEMESAPFNVVSDPRRVRQVLLNLLSNAIKFGEGKPIRVTCKQTDDHGVDIAVIDQGVGIAQEDTSRIFEEFVQVSESKQPGTGLGLPISRRLAQLLDGSLTVSSTPGEGSTFRLILPPSIEDGVPAEPALSGATAG
jgi:signal transduction histidine kinase